MHLINASLIAALEKIYQKHHDQINAVPPVIREIIAYQLNDSSNKLPSGEFTESSVSTLNYQYNLQKYHDENDNDVITRICTYINELASHAAKIHIHDNFGGPILPERNRAKNKKNNIPKTHSIEPILNLERKNHITRLSLNEFGLYPNKYRGPLSIESFVKLTDLISKMASQYPENLHLTLASLPVLITSSEVKNFVIYVQCGRNPILSTFAKACIADFDPTYPKTTNPSYIEDTDETNLSTSNYTYKNNDTPSFPPMSIAYGGNIICSTAGGVVFRTAIDICLDHQYARSKTLINNDIDLIASSGESILPIYCSHIIVSNTFAPIKENVICKTVTLSDPERPQQMHKDFKKNRFEVQNYENTIDIKEPAFGSHTRLNIYAPRTMDVYDNDLKKMIENQNHFIIKLSALKKYREQRPIEANLIHFEINKHIITYLCDTLNDISTSNNISDILKQVILKKIVKLKSLANKKNSETHVHIILKEITENIRMTVNNDSINTEINRLIKSITNLLNIEKNDTKINAPAPSQTTISMFSTHSRQKHHASKHIDDSPVTHNRKKPRLNSKYRLSE